MARLLAERDDRRIPTPSRPQFASTGPSPPNRRPLRRPMMRQRRRRLEGLLARVSHARSHADGAVDTDALRALIDWYVGRGDARHLHQRHERGVVLADARTSGASSPRPRSTRWPAAITVVDRLHRPDRDGGDRARPARASRPAQTGIGSTPPPYSKTLPDETVALLRRHLRRRRRAADGLQLAARRRASTSVPTSPNGSPTSSNVVAIKDSTPNLRAVLRDDEARRRPECASSARS